jgi:hypothetical protein
MAQDAVPVGALLAVIAAALDRALEEPWTKPERVIERTKVIHSVISGEAMQDDPALLVYQLRQQIGRWEAEDRFEQLKRELNEEED